MKRSKNILKGLINDIGIEETSEIVGMTQFELVKYTGAYIDTDTADRLLGDMIKEKIIPKIYNNCELYYDTFSGTLEWECEWEKGREFTVSYATPFWDGQDGIPVETNSYSITMNDGGTITYDDIDNDLKYNFISWKDGFQNSETYIDWIENFYLPKVYDTIKAHLDNFRYFFTD